MTYISNGVSVTLPTTAFETSLSWLAFVTSAIGNSNLHPELNVVSKGNPYICLCTEGEINMVPDIGT
jgi:hypothetical protein